MKRSIIPLLLLLFACFEAVHADVILRHRETGQMLHFAGDCCEDFPDADALGWDCFKTEDCHERRASIDLPTEIKRAFAQDGYAHLPMTVTEKGEAWAMAFAGKHFFDLPKAMFASRSEPTNVSLIKPAQTSISAGSKAAFANKTGMNKLQVWVNPDSGLLQARANISVIIDQPRTWQLFDMEGRLRQQWDFDQSAPLRSGDYSFSLRLLRGLAPNQFYILSLLNKNGEAVLSSKFMQM